MRTHRSVYPLVLSALATALLCALAPLALPLPMTPVPLSLTNLLLLLAVYLLPWRWAELSCLAYLLLGAAGLPVFSGFAGGLGKLAGPTGGYLAGFLLQIPVSGLFLERFRFQKNPLLRRCLHALGLSLGILACYLLGTLWLAFQLKLSFGAALLLGVVPYLPGDAVKIAAAVFLGPALNRTLRRAVENRR